ncbi:ABC transporter permease [Sphingosinicella sp. CPCC 101087]|uniref:ABC transporter permease n=1 Tax=Sphingosinicella sp. CPCC 101087 TaxID=2497754 RepID=UPI00101C5E99|nr:ABC transporter permease [Sphingosinicella sp. CPCC 101087]
MVLHYLKLALRLLVADRWFSLVNLGGLALGLASVLLIGLYVRYEHSYDTFLPKSENLYRVDTVETVPGHDSIEIALAPGPLAGALETEFPQIEAITRAFRTEADLLRENQRFPERILAADPDFFSVIGLPFVAGSPERALDGSRSVAISQRASERLFGDSSAIGRVVTIAAPEPRDFIVSGVFETIPDNSHMAFDVAIPHAAFFGAGSDATMAIPDSWAGAYFHTYVRLRPGARPEDVERRLPALVDRSLPAALREAISTPPHELFQFRFVPVRDVHFEGAAIEAMRPPSSRTTVVALSAVAALILLVACINFGNILAARASLRTREVALRKVVGAKRRDIILQFLLEALLIAGIAGMVSVALVEIALPYIESRLGLPADYLRPNIASVWAGVAALIFATAAAASVYPSLLIARIMPSTALSREFARRSGGRFRTALLVLQFAISIGLVAVTITMSMQWRLTREMDIGFDRADLAVIRMPDGPRQAIDARAFADALARHPDVRGVSLSSAVPSDTSEDNLTIRFGGQSRPVQLGYHRVDTAFFETYGVAPLAGRTASQERASRSEPDRQGDTAGTRPVVLNHSSLDRLGLSRPEEAIGQILQGSEVAYEVVGVVPDLHFRSLHAPIRDEIYLLDDQAGGNISVRIQPGSAERFGAFADRLWRERVPGHPIERAFLADLIGDLYAKEARQLALLTFFSALAIILSCLGLVAMAAFSLQRRTREIAVRKVLGARTRDILRLLMWDLLRPVMLASLIAWPIAWYVARDWLNNFSYRIDMPPLAFVSASLVAVLLAAAAVAAHSVRTSRLHPATALRRE